MNTIHDLRGTLAEHAEIHDVEIGTRPSAIARRVRVVRRRRLAGVGAAVAVVVAAAAGLTLPHTGGNPAPAARVLGVAVPTTLTSTGYTYRYDSSVTSGDGTAATVTVDPGSTPVLVSWATEDADQRVSVSTPFTDFTSTMDDFTDFVVVPEGAGPTKVKVSGAGPTALAVYHLDATPPAGVTTDGITFRRDVADRHLIAAKVMPQGANQLSLTFTMPPFADHLTVSSLCDADKGWIEGTINGKSSFAGDCGRDGTFDPGGAGWLGFGQDFRAGQRVTLTMRLLDHKGGRPLVDPQARLGLGAYESSQQPQRIGRFSLDRTIEAGGHTWTLVATDEQHVRQGHPMRSALPRITERVMAVVAAYGGAHRTTIVPLVDGHAEDGSLSLEAGMGPGSEQVGPIDATSRTVGVRVPGVATDAAIGVYELAD